MEAIAGTATGAIAHSAFIADSLDLPLSYVRTAKKEHGLQNLIEGEIIPNQRTIVVEDLVSTGSSSLKAVSALRESKCNILGMVAIFTYDFAGTIKRFGDAKCKLYTLSNYKALIKSALDSGAITTREHTLIEKWHENPEKWSDEH